MHQLIIKDFRSNWMYLLFVLAILFTLSMTFIYNWIVENGKSDPGLVLYFLMALSSSAVISILFMKVDEVYRTDEIYASLPITRNLMVLARYSGGFVLALLALATHFLGVQLGAYFKGGLDYPELEPMYKPSLWLGMLVLLVLFNSYSYPFFFKLGLSRGVTVVLIISFLLFASFATVMIRIKHAWDGFQDAIVWLIDQNWLMTFPVFVGFFLLVTGGSMALSISFFKNKDL